MLTSQLQIDLFPCTLVIKVQDPKRPAILEKNSGYLESNSLIRILEKYLNTTTQILLQERRLREHQQEELKEAERITIQREKDKNEKIERERIETERKIQEQEARKRQLLEKIGIEPLESENSAQISFKLPSGKRLDRRFLKSERIQTLFDYLESVNIYATELTAGFPSVVLQNRENSLETEGIFPKCVIHLRESNN